MFPEIPTVSLSRKFFPTPHFEESVFFSQSKDSLLRDPMSAANRFCIIILPRIPCNMESPDHTAPRRLGTPALLTHLLTQ